MILVAGCCIGHAVRGLVNIVAILIIVICLDLVIAAKLRVSQSIKSRISIVSTSRQNIKRLNIMPTQSQHRIVPLH